MSTLNIDKDIKSLDNFSNSKLIQEEIQGFKKKSKVALDINTRSDEKVLHDRKKKNTIQTILISTEGKNIKFNK